MLRLLCSRVRLPRQNGLVALHELGGIEQTLFILSRYTAAMMVEESRMLQVSIFETLQENLPNIDFSVLLEGVMAIADEIDSQLSQAVLCFDAESAEEALPV